MKDTRIDLFVNFDKQSKCFQLISTSSPLSDQCVHRSISKGRKSLVIAMVRDGHSKSRDRVGGRVCLESCSSSVVRNGECKGTSSRRSRNCLSVLRVSGSGMLHSMLTVVSLLVWRSSCLNGCQLRKQTRSSDPSQSSEGLVERACSDNLNSKNEP